MAWPKQFSDEEDVKIRNMRERGYTLGHIARELGRTQKQIESHWHWMNKKKQPGEEDKSLAPLWSAEDDAQLFYLRDHDKLQWKEIAQKLGRTTAACSARYNWYRHKRIAESEDETELSVRMSVSRETPARLLPKTYWRKCHDCGKQTPHFRCSKCRDKWKQKHNVEEDEENQGGFDG